MRTIHTLSIIALSLIVITLAPIARAATYPGNGNTGFGGAIGQGSLTLTDDGTNISGTITRGSGYFNDVLVLYIDSVPGGYADTSGFADNYDGFHQAISGFDGGSNRSVLTNAPGFAADYAVAINSAFGGLWGLTNGGYASLPYITSVNVSPTGTSNATFYTFSFPVSAIGLTPGGGGTFKLVGTYVSVSGYRSTEAVAGNVSGTQGWNPFTVIVSTNYTIQGQPRVLNTNDSGPGSLRQVVYEAPANATITFATNLSGGTILLTSGEMVLTRNLTIDASALTKGISINGNHTSRIFSVAAGSTNTFAGLTLTNGNGAGEINSGDGGAIYSEGVLTLTNCTLSGNSASYYGGGVENNSGTLTVSQSTLSGNSVSGAGGGGIENDSGTMTVNQSTLSGNSAGIGGGIDDYLGTMTVNQSTLSGNSAPFGGGGIYNYNDTLNLTNSIVCSNTASSGPNTYSPFSGANDLVDANALLAPLGNYGGPTQTMPPLPGSPAIGAGSDSAASQFTTDQRGFARLVGAHVDIGAVEFGNAVAGFTYGNVVNTNSDVLDGSNTNFLSLRTAVFFATNNATITFATNLSGATILLTNASGELVLTKNLTIDASALASGIAINGNQSSRIFSVAAGSTSTFAGLTLTNGNGLGATNNGFGGAIYSEGVLTLTNCTLAGNSAVYDGGGIENYYGTLTVNQSTLSGNSAVYDGGGIENFFGTLTVNQSTLAGNSATFDGGGIYIYNDTLNLTNSIVCSNTASSGPNIYGSFSGANDLVDTNALLAPLGNYGGPTPTMPPLPGSPAIDGCTNGTAFTTDQRGAGYPRVMNAYADIGAAEALVPSIPNSSFEADTFTSYPGYIFYGANGGISGWSAVVGSVGLNPYAGNNYPFADNGAIPAGKQVAFLQASSSLATTITGLTPGISYLVSFRANGRHSAVPTPTWSLNGGAFVPFTAWPPVNVAGTYTAPYYTNSGSFTATGSTAALVVSNYSTADSTVLVDAFTITPLQVTVTSTNDDGSAGTLRTAIGTVVPGGTITFATNLSGATILLTNGEIVLSNNVTIDATALQNGIQLNGNANSRIFHIANGATVTNNSLTITNGSASGIFVENGTLIVNACSLVGNYGYYGGAIYNSGTTVLNECTCARNSATASGGALYNNGGTLTVNQSTLSGNSASEGGGIENSGALNLYNSIVAGNSGGDLDGGANTTGVNLTNGAPLLAPLGNYGGPTQTMPPLPGSPAIDGCTSGTTFTTDQRGFPRIVGAFADIGAVELQMIPSSSLVVTTNNDILTDSTNNGVSLRSAVFFAPNNATITFATNLSGATILLTNASGELVLTKNLTIDASALANGMSINGNNSSRIFSVSAGSTSTFAGLTLTNGNGAGATLSGYGGAIYSAGVLMLTNCTLAGNSASAYGGGIFNFIGTLTVNQSTLAGNSAGFYGGGIENDGTLTVNQSTLTGNMAQDGGAIINEGSSSATIILNYCTLVANHSTGINGYDGGGAVDNAETLKMTGCIVAGNTSATVGPDIWMEGVSLTATNCLVGDGSTTGLVNGSDGNLVGTTGTPVNANLAPLGNYGGPTQTMPPLPGSPAIGAGSVSAASQFATDQRGLARTVNGLVDIGAVEAGDAIPGYTYRTVVNTNADFAPNGLETNIVSLRSAVAFATNGATITFATNLSGATILLTNSTIVLNKGVTIDASSLSNGVSIDGNHIGSVFYSVGGTNVLTALTITNGLGLNGYGGGGIYNTVNLTLNRCTLTGNSTPVLGGGICNLGGTLTVNQSTLSGNLAVYSGAIENRGNLTVNESTLTGNMAQDGGAIINESSSSATIILNYCTLVANHSTGTASNDGGGAIDNAETLKMTGCIVAGNTSATVGPDIWMEGLSLTATNCLVGDGSTTGLVNGSNGNLVGTTGTPVKANLAPLGNYGGPTQTMPPLPGSPAIDAGSDSVLAFLTTDQRGLPRLVGAHVDIGAVEGAYVTNYSGPGRLIGAARLGNGSGAFQFSFTNYPDLNVSLTVWASTNLALPFAQWSNLGAPVESPAGTFTFTDPQATNNVQRFYRVSSP